jgi:hypothetical protein
VYIVKNPQAFDETPELGMGYHFGKVHSSGAGVIVLNALFALGPEEIMDAKTTRDLLLFEELFKSTFSEIDFTSKDKDLWADDVQKIASCSEILPSDDITLFEKYFHELVSNMKRYKSSPKLHGSPPYPLRTRNGHDFVRFTSFRRDRRLLPDGSLRPGTYVTSANDGNHVPSGFAAVGRYALPNPVPAINRFHIAITGSVSGQMGTVSPAFGQAGGGVEIEFVGGAPPRSLTRRSMIPEY